MIKVSVFVNREHIHQQSVLIIAYHVQKIVFTVQVNLMNVRIVIKIINWYHKNVYVLLDFLKIIMNAFHVNGLV